MRGWRHNARCSPPLRLRREWRAVRRAKPGSQTVVEAATTRGMCGMGPKAMGDAPRSPFQEAHEAIALAFLTTFVSHRVHRARDVGMDTRATTGGGLIHLPPKSPLPGALQRRPLPRHARRGTSATASPICVGCGAIGRCDRGDSIELRAGAGSCPPCSVRGAQLFARRTASVWTA